MKNTKISAVIDAGQPCLSFGFKRLTQEGVQLVNNILTNYISQNSYWRVEQASTGARHLRVFSIIPNDEPENSLLKNLLGVKCHILANLQKHHSYGK